MRRVIRSGWLLGFVFCVACAEDGPSYAGVDTPDVAGPEDASDTSEPQPDMTPAPEDTAPDVPEPDLADTSDAEADPTDADLPDASADVAQEVEDVVSDVVEDLAEPEDIRPDEPDVSEPPVYLVNSANGADVLRLYDVTEDRVVTACTFDEDINYPSITFGLDGTLYGSRSGQFLDVIDPCSCEVTPVGDMGYTGVVGITANGVKDIELYGLTHISDLLLVVDLEDGSGSPVGNGLGVDFGYSGSTWSSDIPGLFAINSTTNTLYQIGTQSGLATDPVQLDANFGTVGIEWHPVDRNLYACTDAAVYRVDPDTGETTHLTQLSGGCNNLAAPWIRIPCLEDRLAQ